MLKTSTASFRCSCGYFPGQNFSGNCAKCMAIISQRGSAKRGVSRREHSLSPPAHLSKSIKEKGQPPQKRPKKAGETRQPRSSDDEFDLDKSPPPRKTAKPLIHQAASSHKAASSLKAASSHKAASSLKAAAKPAGLHPPAGMYPKAVLNIYYKAIEGLNGKKLMAAKQQQASAVPPPKLSTVVVAPKSLLNTAGSMIIARLLMMNMYARFAVQDANHPPALHAKQ